MVHAIRADVAIGKSDASRREAVRLLIDMRARGDRRVVVLAVPTHKLGDEQARDFENLPEARAAGLRAAVWRGRAAPDPDANGETMCLDLEATRDAQSIGARVETAVCRKKDAECPFFRTCGYQRQKRAVADLWIVPHELLFSEKPKAIGKVAALIVDEAAWEDGLEGVNGPPMEIALDSLDPTVAGPGDRSGLETERLRHVHKLFRVALDTQEDSPLRRDAMLAAGLDASTGKDGRIISWRRVADPGLVPGMDAAERRALMRAAAENRTAIRLARAFGALGACCIITGRNKSAQYMAHMSCQRTLYVENLHYGP